MDTGRVKKRFGNRLMAIGIAAAWVIVALLFWAATRETATEKLINQRLAELRAAGEPLDAAALAKMLPLPPPELDADILLKDALAFAHTNRAPGITPIIMSGAPLTGTQAMDATIINVLRRHYEDSADITNVMPLLPPGVRFGEDWARGILKTKVVSFVSVRETIQMLSTRAIYAAEVGDAAGATAMIERSFQFARAVPSDSSLVCHMIRQACMGLACTVVQRCLNRIQFSDAQLQRILESMPSGTNDIVGTFRVEHCTTVWVFNEVRAGKRLDDLMLPGTAKPWWKRAANRLWRPRNEYNDQDFLGYLELMPRVIETAALPPRRAIDECRRLFTTYASNATCEVAQAAIPSWTKAIQTHHEIEAHLEATRAALNVERFRMANGRPPETMAALAPIFTPRAPLDPFDGQPFRFKALNPGYTVYSIGADGVDDGGLAKTNAPVPKNYDITVTVQRPWPLKGR
jgi:hypothetical protein